MHTLELEHREHSELVIRNTHFDVVDAYRHATFLGDKDRVFSLISADFRTAIQEDFMGSGSYTLELLSGEDGKKRFTNASYPHVDLFEMGEAAIRKADEKNLDIRRPTFELFGVKSLFELFTTMCQGEYVFWTSPPGDASAGYHRQTSMTYVAEIIEAGKSMRVAYKASALSLRGHARLYEEVAGTLPVVDRDFFVSTMTSLSSPTMDSVRQIFDAVDQLVVEGYENSEADMSGFVEDQMMSAAGAQITEAEAFLADVFFEILGEYGGTSLDQHGVDKLERAYEMVYKRVLKVAKGVSTRVFSREDLHKDLRAIQTHVLKSSQRYYSREVDDLDLVAWQFAQTIDQRYGIEPISMGGANCPGGQSLGLGFDLSSRFGLMADNGLMGIFQAERVGVRIDSSSWVWTDNETCQDCGAEHVEVGPCYVCRSCQWKYDMGLKS